jgi:hypothetical protein
MGGGNLVLSENGKKSNEMIMLCSTRNDKAILLIKFYKEK